MFISVAVLNCHRCCLPKDLCLNRTDLQDGVKQTEVDSFVAQQFRQADTDGDGQVTFEDFCEYYEAMSISRARLELRSTMGMEAEREHPSLLTPDMQPPGSPPTILAQVDYQNLQSTTTLHVCQCAYTPSLLT